MFQTRKSTDLFYELLGEAIVAQAAKDYENAYRDFKRAKNVSDAKVIYSVKELERFFTSNFYSCITKVDGHYIMEKIREKVDSE